MKETTSIKVRRNAFEGIRKIGTNNRLTVLEVVSVLLNGWDQLTDEQKIAAIRTPDPSRSSPSRKRQPVPT